MIGMFFTVVSLFTMSGTAARVEDEQEIEHEPVAATSEAEVQMHDMKSGKIPKRNRIDSDSDEDADGAKAKSHVFAISQTTIWFHVQMIGAAIYYSMLCTNWLNPELYEQNPAKSQVALSTTATFWAKVVAQWLTMVVYLFSLIGPMLCPDRQFA